MPKSKSIAVIGGAGYIGSACVRSLIKNGHKVVVFDNLSSGQKNKLPSEAVFTEGSITDIRALEQLFSKHSFDTVFHFAAKKAVGESEEKPALYFQNNVTGTANLLEAMSVHYVPEIIFSSTAAVYAPDNSDNPKPFIEESPLAPINVYGQTKVMAEEIIKTFHRLDKIKKYSILRYFNVAGDVGLRFREQNAQNVFPLIAEALNANKEFFIFGTDYNTKDGTCVRDYIHLADLIEGHLAAFAFGKNGTYNLGTGTGYSVRELVEAFTRISGKKLQVQESPRRAGDPAVVIANSDKAQNELGWRTTHTLDDIVRGTLAGYGGEDQQVLK